MFFKDMTPLESNFQQYRQTMKNLVKFQHMGMSLLFYHTSFMQYACVRVHACVCVCVCVYVCVRACVCVCVVHSVYV